MSAQPPRRAPDRDADREQEQSIRRRKQLLFDEEEAFPVTEDGQPVVRKSFAEYLRDTPAAPISPGVKAMLWAAGVVVVLLLVGALYKATQPKRPAPPARTGALAAPFNPRQLA